MYLGKIIAHKREEIRSLRPVDREREKPVVDPLPSLRKRPLIAEIKKASPSAGDIRPAAAVRDVAAAYALNGAGAVSVLTDARFFKGSLDDLASVSAIVDIPVLCKDFILDEVQVENAYRCGADIVLLIAAALEPSRLKELSGKAESLGLTVLYEIHYIEEMEKLAGLEPRMVGVNSRDLVTFEINREHAALALGRLDGDFLKIAESGIRGSEDLRSLRRAGADAFLVGTSLMKAEDPGRKLAEYAAALEGLRVR